MIDAIVVSGKGATSDLYVKEAIASDLRPGKRVIRHKVNENLLKPCLNPSKSYSPVNVTATLCQLV